MKDVPGISPELAARLEEGYDADGPCVGFPFTKECGEPSIKGSLLCQEHHDKATALAERATKAFDKIFAKREGWDS